VKLFAQHGFSDGLKTVEGLRKELIDGVIFSPRDITPEKLRECASKFTESAPISERLFDPQYYATLSALDPLSRTGYLQEEYSCYFAPRRYDQLHESEVSEDVSKVLECEAALLLTALIGPNIIIGRSFDSPEAAIRHEFCTGIAPRGWESGRLSPFGERNSLAAPRSRLPGTYTTDNVTGISIPRTKRTSSSTASKLELLLKQASCPAKPLCLTSLSSAIRSYPRRHKTHG
jgi:hypothetical protein